MLIARISLIVTALALLGAAVALPAHQTTSAQPEKKAEEQYKNIVSFKGEKAKEIIPAMHMMSASLGANCTFCHVEGDFASDAKDEKKTAREMIAMTKDINAKEFNGFAAISCMSCHNGHNRPTNLASAVNVRAGLRADKTMSADTVLKAFATASGTLSPGSALHLTGTVASGGHTMPLNTYETADGKFYEMSGSSASDAQAMQVGFDGSTSWYSRGGKAEAVPAPNNAGLIRYGGFFWGGVSGLTDLTVGKEPINGKPMDVVRGTQSGGTAVKLYFDSTTHLLARVAYIDKTILGNMGEVYDYTDYQTVSGVTVPTTVIQHTSPTDSTVRKYSSVVVETDVPATTFGLPKG